MVERNNKDNIKIGEREIIKTIANFNNTKNWFLEKQTECKKALAIQ